MKNVGSVGTVTVTTVAAQQQVDDLIVIIARQARPVENLLPVSVHIAGYGGFCLVACSSGTTSLGLVLRWPACPKIHPSTAA